MKIIQSHDNHISGDSWRILGDLELSESSDADSAIYSWLTELLSSLSLSADFLNRVVESVQETIRRVLHLNATSTSGHIHLSIFAPYERILERKTWGFFHIERIENQGEAVNSRDHAIDFYLYVEG